MYCFPWGIHCRGQNSKSTERIHNRKSLSLRCPLATPFLSPDGSWGSSSVFLPGMKSLFEGPFTSLFIFRRTKVLPQLGALWGFSSPPASKAISQVSAARRKEGLEERRKRLALGLMLKGVLSFICAALTSKRRVDSCITGVIKSQLKNGAHHRGQS